MYRTAFLAISFLCFITLLPLSGIVHAQDIQGQTMVIEDIDSSKSGSESVGAVEDAYLPDEAADTEAQKPAVTKPKLIKKPGQNQNVPARSQNSRRGLKIFFDTLLAIVTLLLFVVALIYFFRRKLAEALSKSSKDRKTVSDILKKFNIDLDKLLPPPPPQ